MGSLLILPSMWCRIMTNNPIPNQELKPNELLPCPFCGNKHIVIWNNNKHSDPEEEPDYIASCANSDCDASIDECDTWQEAAFKWNTRHSPPRPRGGELG